MTGTDLGDKELTKYERSGRRKKKKVRKRETRNAIHGPESVWLK